jgi:frataxin-like iron-binding protein CyaY
MEAYVANQVFATPATALVPSRQVWFASTASGTSFTFSRSACSSREAGLFRFRFSRYRTANRNGGADQ